MKYYQITVDGRTFDVRLLSDPRQPRVEVEVDGHPLTVEIEPVLAHEPPAPATTTRDPLSPGLTPKTSDANIAAPLPGMVKSVAVQPGQKIAVGDPLLVIEAMKMDNVIRAPRDGVIGTVHVLAGHRVVHGDPLIDYKEP